MDRGSDAGFELDDGYARKRWKRADHDSSMCSRLDGDAWRVGDHKGNTLDC